MTTLTETRKPGDLIIHMESQEYCCESKVIKTQAASGVLTDLADVVGYPLILSGSDYKLAKSGDEANVVALIVDGPPIEDLVYTAATTAQYKILTKAPEARQKPEPNWPDYNEKDRDIRQWVNRQLVKLDQEIMAGLDEYKEENNKKDQHISNNPTKCHYGFC